MSESDSSVPYGYCICGCGKKTNLATYTNPELGYIKGQPYRYLRGHSGATHLGKPGPNPGGLCKCGCRQTTPLATRSYARRGIVKGQHLRVLPGHYSPRVEWPIHVHALQGVNPELRIALCTVCGPVGILRGTGGWRCREAARPRRRKYRKQNPDHYAELRRRLAPYDRRPSEVYRPLKKEVCERCGFVAEHPRQLDVHHLDENRHNNEPTNLETLCANCHRLVHASHN